MGLGDRLIISMAEMEENAQLFAKEGVIADDLGKVTAYLNVLTEHGEALASLAVAAIRRAAPGHPVRVGENALSVQLYIGHAKNLLEAAQTFVSDAEQLLMKMSSDPA
ncbi:hypothetical protein GCM10023195_17570 [Actinoallomurus liliacearum]|uniref:PhoU domain-containing protein n=1 Tax=Actinoallomurus liliacearum TaxID=1080073 RepID=A0ABP8TFC0_9ACTN